MSIRMYRVLILFSVFVGIASALLDLVFPSLLPEAFYQALEEHGSDLSASGFWAIEMGSMILLLVGVISTVGLYFFRCWRLFQR